ncbi:MAG TPA: hypothetical protein ENJ08_06690 [Gammaproteobacteria bacterium]|nr:hypothetical protein [Gammaproteobacteria bacterium]
MVNAEAENTQNKACSYRGCFITKAGTALVVDATAPVLLTSLFDPPSTELINAALTRIMHPGKK